MTVRSAQRLVRHALVFAIACAVAALVLPFFIAGPEHSIGDFSISAVDGHVIVRQLHPRPTTQYASAWRAASATPEYDAEWRVQTRALIAMPFLMPALCLPFLLIAARREKRCLAAAVCPICGYDLRATPNACPECGYGSVVDEA